MIKVAVFGARGRMGAEVCHAVEAADGLELVAALDLGDDREPAKAATVAVDFTHPEAVLDNLLWCIEHGINVVVGTTGFTDERLEQLRGMLARQPAVGVLVAANFSIGAVLMMHFAAQAAAFYESAEVIELHRPDKADAPSGTPLSPPGGSPPPVPPPTSPRHPTPPCRSCQEPAVRRWTASGSTGYGCAGWSPTRRSCSAPKARPSPSDMTRWTGSPSCPA